MNRKALRYFRSLPWFYLFFKVRVCSFFLHRCDTLRPSLVFLFIFQSLGLILIHTPLLNPHTRGFNAHTKPHLFFLNKWGNESQSASLLCDPRWRVTTQVSMLPWLFFQSQPLFHLFDNILQTLCRLRCFRLLFLLLLG